MFPKLFSREDFREFVFRRDSYKCIICHELAVDAHHIIDRKCWPDGGYYLDNGVSLCSKCHLEAEQSILSPQDLRNKINLKILVPSQLSKELEYDKWGNCISTVVKYPKTMHLPWSENLQNDDRRIENLDGLIGQEVVITEKMDGENTSLYRDYIHARSPSPIAPHPSRSRIKQLHERIRSDIPQGWRFVGENCFAQHSIHYANLPGYFLLFGLWKGDNCASWSETKDWAQLLGLPIVPELWSGIFTKELEWKISSLDYVQTEGYVVRVVREFRYSEFQRVVGKFVRKNHVRTSKHWMTQPIVENLLADGN